jgi:glycosyltransferase involved in cell wall biosynthesis
VPKVSVIIPTYNRARYIRAAIESLLAQTFKDYEIIVVDDGSTDDTETVLKTGNYRLIYMRQPHSGLPAVARNTALRRARGEYVAFLDSDDEFLPDKLSTQVARLDAEPSLALVYSDALYFQDEGSVVGTLLGDWHPSQGKVFLPLIVTNFMATCSVMLRKDCLDTLGLFDESPAVIEDYDLWLRIAARYDVGFVEGMSSRIRFHKQNISGGDKIPQYVGMLNVLAKAARLDPALLAGHKPMWRERCSLLHLAAARAYARHRKLPQAVVHLARCIGVNPDPRWLAHLATTPHPARTWLESTLARVT